MHPRARIETAVVVAMIVASGVVAGVGRPQPARPATGAAIEQPWPGTSPPATLVASFDGLGVGFDGPQASPLVRNPSDNSLAVGPNHIVQTVNSRMAIFTKKGKKFDTTGRVLYGAVATNNVFRGFGGTCEGTNNGSVRTLLSVRVPEAAVSGLPASSHLAGRLLRSDQHG